MTLLKKSILCCALFAVFAIPSLAQDTLHENKRSFDLVNKLLLEVRADLTFNQPFVLSELEGLQSTNIGESTYGFVGRYFNLHMGGNLTKDLSYYFRQRIVANPGSNSFFDNTDFLYLNYRFHKNWSLRVGKEALAVGGFEYDAPPIDVLFWSYYWDNFYCFQLAAGVTFHSNDEKNTLTLQVGNSPYLHYGSPFKNSLLSYNLLWSGNFGHFKTLYSFNMFERKRGVFMNYIALGNKLDYDHFSVYLDLLHHACSTRQLFKDFGVVARADFKFNPLANLFVKAGYEQNLDEEEIANFNSTGEIWDCLALPGQQYIYYGIGFEWHPKKYSDIRLHGFVTDIATINDYAPALQDPDIQAEHNLYANIGVTWKIDIAKYFRNK